MLSALPRETSMDEAPRRAPNLITGQLNNLRPCRHGYLAYNARDLYVGKALELYGEFSESEVDVFRQLVRPGDTVLDIGANMGTHTIYFAQAVGPQGSVHAFEPQRMLFQLLCGNVALNSLANVYCHHAAVGDRSGSLLVPRLDFAVEQNLGGLSVEGHQQGESVPLVTVDSLSLEACRLIKADVEGMELAVLKGAGQTIERFHPVLYVENDREDRSAELMRWIANLGYKMHWHQAALYNPDNYDRNPENVFGGTISLNLLCLHPETGIAVTGFEDAAVP